MLLVDTRMLGGSYSILISAGLLVLNVLMVAAMSHAAARDIRLSQGKAEQLKALTEGMFRAVSRAKDRGFLPQRWAAQAGA